jgi:uncharacterized membrane protein YjjP (DUF1212 family)
VGSGPEVGVFEPKLVARLSKASSGAFKLFLEFYKSLSLVIWFTALSNLELSDNPIAALSSLIIVISPLIPVLLKNT